MGLFTDADFITLDDLLQFESSLVEVASTHGINVTNKINLSKAAIGDKITLWLLRSGASDPKHVSRRYLGLSTVVVTPPLNRWLCFDTLARFFAEAYNVQLNTRFESKWTEYLNEAATAEQMFAVSGIGVVSDALPKPAEPNVSIVNGDLPAQTMFIQTAWVDGQGNEGALSPVNAQSFLDGSGVVVGMAEGIVKAPRAASGWNVYISATENGPTLQNGAPLLVGATWTLPATGLVDGAEPQGGQQPNFYINDPKRSQRG